jgi:predicted nuclease of predicted toxin-antitoxin system
LRLKLDENLSRHLKPQLAELGHDVATAGDEGMLGRPDIELGAAAKNEQRMVLTLDLEFADLRKYPPGSHPGVLLFRPRSMGPLAVNRFVQDFIKAVDLEEFAGCNVVVEYDRVRLRRPPPDV